MNYLGDTREATDDMLTVMGKLIHGATEDEHPGWDWGAPKGTKVVSMFPGQVVRVFTSPNGALSVRIRDRQILVKPGYYLACTYSHFSRVLVSEGQLVSRADDIGLVGHTGTTHIDHLHVNFGANTLPGYGEDYFRFDPFAVQFPTSDSFKQISFWTVYNNPQCVE